MVSSTRPDIWIVDSPREQSSGHYRGQGSGRSVECDLEGYRAFSRCYGCAGSRGVPLIFDCSRPQARAPVTRYGLVFVFRTSRTSRTCFGLSRFRLRCCRIGSARSGSRSHGYPIIAQTRSTELRRSSAASPYVLTIVSSCSADSGLTQPLAATYASCMTHAVSSSMYLNAPGLASCSSVRPLGHWDR
jgi:hypothetical protein